MGAITDPETVRMVWQGVFGLAGSLIGAGTALLGVHMTGQRQVEAEQRQDSAKRRVVRAELQQRTILELQETLSEIMGINAWRNEHMKRGKPIDEDLDHLAKLNEVLRRNHLQSARLENRELAQRIRDRVADVFTSDPHPTGMRRLIEELGDEFRFWNDWL